MRVMPISPFLPFPGYSQGDGLDGFQSLKILLNNCVNEGNFFNVSSDGIRVFSLFPTVNVPVTIGDDERIPCSTKQVVRKKPQFLPIRSQGIHHPDKNLGKVGKKHKMFIISNLKMFHVEQDDVFLS